MTGLPADHLERDVCGGEPNKLTWLIDRSRFTGLLFVRSCHIVTHSLKKIDSGSPPGEVPAMEADLDRWHSRIPFLNLKKGSW